MKHQKKFLLSEQDLPTQWYNIQAEMPNKPMPPLNPKTHEPLTAEDLSHIFNMECSKQELDQTHPWIDIPEEVQEKYAYYRATPLVRAYAFEQAIGTRAHIYFKTRARTRWDPTRSIPPCLNVIIARRKATPMSPRKQEPDSGEQPFHTQQNFTDLMLQCIK